VGRRRIWSEKIDDNKGEGGWGVRETGEGEGQDRRGGKREGGGIYMGVEEVKGVGERWKKRVGVEGREIRGGEGGEKKEHKKKKNKKLLALLSGN